MTVASDCGGHYSMGRNRERMSPREKDPATSKTSGINNEDYHYKPLKWPIAPTQMGSRSRRGNALPSLSGRKEWLRKLEDFLRIFKVERGYCEVCRFRVTE